MLLCPCTLGSYIARMSTEVYCIFGVVLTRMEEYGALVFMNTLKSSSANSMW